MLDTDFFIDFFFLIATSLLIIKGVNTLLFSPKWNCTLPLSEVFEKIRINLNVDFLSALFLITIYSLIKVLKWQYITFGTKAKLSTGLKFSSLSWQRNVLGKNRFYKRTPQTFKGLNRSYVSRRCNFMWSYVNDTHISNRKGLKEKKSVFPCNYKYQNRKSWTVLFDAYYILI